MKKIIFALAIIVSSQAEACIECVRGLCMTIEEKEFQLERKFAAIDRFDKGYIYGFKEAIQYIYQMHPDTRLTLHEYETIFKRDRRDGDRE